MASCRVHRDLARRHDLGNWFHREVCVMTVATANAFAIDVWRAMPSLTRYARHLWAGDYHGAEDGMQEAVCRAIAYRHKFKGGNLAAWLNRMLRNIRCDQLAKGYGKSADRSKRPEGDARGRLLYFGEYDAIAPLNPMVNRCDPESILIAMEDHCMDGTHAICAPFDTAPIDYGKRWSKP